MSIGYYILFYPCRFQNLIHKLPVNLLMLTHRIRVTTVDDRITKIIGDLRSLIICDILCLCCYGMTNNEKFNALLNSCANPRQIYNALLALAAAGFTMERLKQETEDVAGIVFAIEEK